MATVIGTVTNIQGMAIVVDANGNRHMLKVGEVLHAGDKVITATGAAVSVKLANGETVNFAEAQTVKITDNLAQVDVSDVSENAVNQTVFDAVLTALNEGRDITEVLDSPAAGEAGSDGNASFVNLDRIQTGNAGGANYDGGAGAGGAATNGSIAPNYVYLSPASGAPVITLADDKDNDGYLNASDLGNATTTKATVTLPAGLEPGDTLNVVHNGGTISVELTAANIAAGSVDVAIPVPAQGSTLTVTASITNQSGQVSPSTSDSAIIDTVAPGAPIVTIDSDTNNDGYINKAELGTDTTAKVTVTLPATAMPGDQLLVTVNGGTPTAIVLTQADITKGSVNVPGVAVPASGQTLTVEAQVKDVAGNLGDKGADSAKVDTGIPNDGVAPTVEITTDANNDGFINRAEQGNSATDDVKVSFNGAKVEVGDVITVTDGTVTKNITIDATAKSNGYVTTTFAKPVEGGFLKVDAYISDAAGNKSDTGTDAAKLDTSALTGLSITLTTDSNDDAYINKAELTAAGNKVSAEIKLPLDAAAGDSLVVTGTGNTTQTITLTQAQIDAGKVVVSFNPPANGVDLQVTAQVSDPAGNKSNIGTDHAVIITDGPGAPTVTLTTDTNNDGYINQGELNGGNTVQVLVGIPGTAKAGDTLTINDGINPPQNHVLTPADITAGSYTTTVPAPASGTTLTVTALITDVAGNPSNTGSDTATIDTTVFSGLAIEIRTDANNDGFINRSELTNNKIDVRVTVPQGAVAGDTLTVTGSGNVAQTIILTAAQVQTGYVDVSFNPTLNGTDFVSTASIKDPAGNASGPVQDAAKLQLVAPGAPIVTIDSDTNNDGYINKAELGTDTTAKVTVTLPATAMPGDQLLVTVNGGTPTAIVLTQADITKGSVNVPGVAVPASGQTLTVEAQVKDVAGNLGDKGADSAKVDTGIPNDGVAPTVEITTDANNDGFINRAEQGNSATDDVKVSFNGAKVEVGDVITVTDGTVTKNITIDATAKSNGYVTTTFAKPVEGGFLKVDAYISDAAGNKSDTGTDAAKLDTSALTGLSITLTTDSNDDAYINKAELTAAGNKVSAEIKLPLDAAAGDSLVVTGTGNTTQTITLTQAQIDAGKVVVSFNPPANGVDLQVTAQVSDPAGNKSNIGTDHAVIITDGPGAPTVTLTTDTNNDGYINQGELNGGNTVQVLVGIPGTAKAGDTLTINDGINPPQNHVLTPADITAGSYTTTVPAPASGTTLTVTALITDVAGNPSNTGSDTATIDTTVFSGLAIEIRTDANNDGFINRSELTNNKIDVRVTVPQGAVAGDTLTVTGSGNVAQTIILTAAQVQTGYVDVSFNPTLNGTDFVSTASIKDPAGNASGPVQDAAKLQLVAPGAPIVTIDSDTNNDGYINKAELGTDTTAKVTVTLPATAMPGDQLLVTVNGGTPTAIVLTQADITKGSVNVPGVAVPASGQTLTVEAQVKDVAGNLGDKGADSAKVDTGIPNDGVAPTVEITTDANNDGFINRAEQGNSATDDVKVSFNGAKVEVGDVITVTDGTVTKNITIDATAKSNGYVTTTFAKPVEGGFLKVDAYISDAAGNKSDTGTDAAKLDTSALTGLSITLTTDSNDDAYINKAELTAAGNKVSAEIKLPLDAAAGDSLVVTGTGNTTQTITLTQAQIDAGKVVVSFNPPANGVDLQVTAQVSDPAGNKSNIGTDHAVIITDGPGAPTVTLTTDTNNDGYINQGELNGGNTVQVLVGIPGTAKAGDTLTINDGINPPQNHVLTPADITAGSYTTTVPAPASGTTLTVTALITDVAGNPSNTGSDTATIDTTVFSGLAIEIRTDANNDGFINRSELTNNKIDVRVTVPQGAVAGDTLTVTGSGNVAQTIILTAAQVQTGYVDVSFNPTLNGTDFVSTASIKDPAGNASGPVQDAAKLQLVAPGAPIVTIDSDTNNDGYINKAELGTDTTAKVTVTLPATAMPGDQLLVTVNGGTPTAIVLTQADITKGSVNVPGVAVPASGQTLTVEAQVKDVAGNLGDKGADSAKVDTGIPNDGVAPTVEITTDANNDGFINRAEQGNSATDDVKVSFNGAKVEVGDVITVTDGTVTKNITIDATAKSNGYVTTTFAKPVEGGFLKVDAYISDAAGNKSDTGTDAAKLDTSALTGLSITLTTDSNDDAYINKAELTAAGNKVSAEIKLPLDAAAGDSLVVTGTGNTTQTITLTQAQIDAGKVVVSFNPPANGVDLQVTAQVSDPAGNKSNIGTDHAVIITDGPGAPTVTLTTDTNNDGYINQGELNGGNTVQVLVGIPGTAKAGDTLTINDGINPPQNHVLTPADITAGSYTTTVPAPASGTTLTVTALITDVAGNPSNTGSDTATIDTTVFSGLAIEIRTDANNDGFINRSELTNNKIDVRVTVPQGAVAGDTLTVTGSGNVAQTIILTAAQVQTGYVDVSFNPTLNGTDFVSTASIKDPAGNASGPVQDAAKLQLVAPGAPIVTIDSDTNNDGYINKAELGTDTTAKVTVTLPATAMPGDQLLVTVNGGTPTAIVLTQADITKGSVNVPGVAVPASGQTLTVEAQVKDVAGNLGDKGADSAKVDTSAPNQPTIDNIYDDFGAVKGNVASGGVADDATPTLTGKAEAGSTVTIYDGSTKVGTAIANQNGTWTFTPTADISKGLHNYTATSTDVAGNVSVPSNLYAYTLNQSPVFVTADATASVSEDGLPGGLIDAGPSNVVASGSMGISDPDGDLKSVTLTEPTTTYTSGGATITWSGNNTGTLIGSANGKEVIRVSIDSKGDYAVQLSGPIDHPVAGQEDTLAIKFGVNANDADSTTKGSITVNVSDDAPTATNQTVTATNTANTNVMITLDISGSMDTRDGVNNQSRLDSAIQSVKNLLDKYDDMGDVKVALVVFAGLDQTRQLGNGWLSVADAKAYLNSLIANGNTNYDSALNTAMSAFNTSGKLDNAQNVSYFFTDGQPNRGAGGDASLNGSENSNNSDRGIQQAEEATWITFLNNNHIKSYSIGIGSGVTSNTELNPIAYDGQTGVNTDGVRVTSFNQLDSVLNETVSSSITGSLLSGGGFGADGGFVKSLAVEGSTYTFNATTGAITVTGTNNSTYDSTSHKLVITTAQGTLLVDMDDGSFSFTPKNTSVAGTAAVNYTLSDKDGDTSSATLTVNVAKTVAAIPQVAPEVSNSLGASGLITLPGLLNVDLLNFASRQAFTASDVNNNISSVTIAYNTLLGVTLGSTFLTYSQAVADELGLNVSYNQNNGLLGLLGANGKMVITSADGSTIDNLAINEFLSTVKAGTQILNLGLFQNFTITASDSTNLQDSESASNLINLNLLSSNNSSSILSGDSGSNTINGTSGDDIIYGFAGNDTLNGNGGNDILRGGAGDDKLDGGAGNDILIGGKGNDTLTGGAGVDVFKWDQGDDAKVNNLVPRDTITDFNKNAVSQGGDILDVRDLLQGENAGNLVNYIHFEKSGSDTIVHISSNGGFATDAHNVSGSFSSGNTTQQIVLSGVDLTTGQTSDAAIISNLLSQQKLITD